MAGVEADKQHVIPRITTAWAVLNLAAGAAGPDVAPQLHAIADKARLDLKLVLSPPASLTDTLAEAVKAAPELLIVLGGDGTAALAAGLCGASGPLLAPLPGGTMNMLANALYGGRTWQGALQDVLTDGKIAHISGGEVEGRRFYVAAILGEAALWAEVREAIRQRRPRLAMLRTQIALTRMFAGRLHYSLDGGPACKTEALSLICPLTSRRLDRNDALEAAAVEPRDVFESARLGIAALSGRWRDDDAVTTQLCASGEAWTRGNVCAILDGEPVRLASKVSFKYQGDAFRALVPKDFRFPAREPTRSRAFKAD